jgi:hypothetical protein
VAYDAYRTEADEILNAEAGQDLETEASTADATDGGAHVSQGGRARTIA